MRSATCLQSWRGRFATVTLGIIVSATGGMQARQHASGHTAAMTPSGFGESVDRDLARLQRATERFKDAREAIRAGYPAVTQCVAHPTEGGMGLHFTREDLRDATLDVEHPEVLVYERLASGALRLNGVEFIVPISAWTSPEPPRILGQPLKRADSLGIWYLHVWNWTANPSGLFADWNPEVVCRSDG
jgi:hypothetical protein